MAQGAAVAGHKITIDGQIKTLDVNQLLPPHYCLWYAVSDDKATILKPCPSPEAILDRFEDMIAKKSNKFW